MSTILNQIIQLLHPHQRSKVSGRDPQTTPNHSNNAIRSILCTVFSTGGLMEWYLIERDIAGHNPGHLTRSG